MKGKIKVNLLDQAEEDLLEIIDFIASDRPLAAEKMLGRFEQAFTQLSLNPHSGRRTRDSRLSMLGYRYMVVSTYLIFYKVQPNAIYIYRILHGARNYVEIL